MSHVWNIGEMDYMEKYSRYYLYFQFKNIDIVSIFYRAMLHADA